MKDGRPRPEGNVPGARHDAVSDSPPFRLFVHARARELVAAACGAPDGYVVTVKEETRNLEQNARLRAMLADIVEGKDVRDFGKPTMTSSGRALSSWLGDCHFKAEGGRQGIEARFVLIRRSTPPVMTVLGRSEKPSGYLEAFMAKRGGYSIRGVRLGNHVFLAPSVATFVTPTMAVPRPRRRRTLGLGCSASSKG